MRCFETEFNSQSFLGVARWLSAKGFWSPDVHIAYKSSHERRHLVHSAIIVAELELCWTPHAVGSVDSGKEFWNVCIEPLIDVWQCLTLKDLRYYSGITGVLAHRRYGPMHCVALKPYDRNPRCRFNCNCSHVTPKSVHIVMQRNNHKSYPRSGSGTRKGPKAYPGASVEKYRHHGLSPCLSEIDQTSREMVRGRSSGTLVQPTDISNLSTHMKQNDDMTKFVSLKRLRYSRQHEKSRQMKGIESRHAKVCNMSPLMLIHGR